MTGSEQRETWQRLLGLESRDVVQWRFGQMHGRELNDRRAREINAAARQAREYFRNAAAADYSVRPLLAFYGVASLSRALLLVVRRRGGEEGLTAGYGLETVASGSAMSGDVAKGLEGLGELRARRRGLFSDFLVHARNTTLIHHHAAAVTGHVEYDDPGAQAEVSLQDLFSRSPDLWADYASVSAPNYANAVDFSYGEEEGLKVDLGGDSAAAVATSYGELGYGVSGTGDRRTIRCDAKTASGEPPMFMQGYMHKTFGTFPALRLAKPFAGGARFSELCVTYMVSYALGMLVRYYPTHWIALINGGRGDQLWPMINRAQQCVESVFPELVAEYVAFAMSNPAWVAQGAGQDRG